MSTAALLRPRGLEATLYASRHHIPNNDLPIIAAGGHEMWCAVRNAQDIFFVPIPLCVIYFTHYPMSPCIFEEESNVCCMFWKMLIPHRPARKVLVSD